MSREYDRGAAILEIEQALFLMALKESPPDRIWDSESATGLATLRQRVVTAGISENTYGHKLMEHDPATSIDPAVFILNTAVWRFFNRYYPGRRGMALVSDGPERIFVKLLNRPQALIDKEASPFDWCLSKKSPDAGPIVTLGIELPFAADGTIDLRQSRGTPLNRVLNTVVVPFLAQNCPGALEIVKNYPRFQILVFLRGEVLGQGVLRKQCDTILGDGYLSVEAIPDPEIAGSFVASAWGRLSAVGLEGVPDLVITPELLDEEELFAPRINCGSFGKDDGVAYLSQFKNRFGY